MFPFLIKLFEAFMDINGVHHPHPHYTLQRERAKEKERAKKRRRDKSFGIICMKHIFCLFIYVHDTTYQM